jgi:phage tail-like protein
MAEDGSTQHASIWPMPKFHFLVKWGDAQMSFQEVSGLEVKSDEIKYRAGDSSIYSVVKMPGIVTYNNVTMKKGIFKGDNKFWDWFSQIKMNTIKRINVTISLLDETDNPTMTWTLKNAWPTKISSDGMKSDDNSVAIETIEIVHEGLTIENK